MWQRAVDSTQVFFDSVLGKSDENAQSMRPIWHQTDEVDTAVNGPSIQNSMQLPRIKIDDFDLSEDVAEFNPFFPNRPVRSISPVNATIEKQKSISVPDPSSRQFSDQRSGFENRSMFTTKKRPTIPADFAGVVATDFDFPEISSLLEQPDDVENRLVNVRLELVSDDIFPEQEYVQIW